MTFQQTPNHLELGKSQFGQKCLHAFVEDASAPCSTVSSRVEYVLSSSVTSHLTMNWRSLAGASVTCGAVTGSRREAH